MPYFRLSVFTVTPFAFRCTLLRLLTYSQSGIHDNAPFGWFGSVIEKVEGQLHTDLNDDRRPTTKNCDWRPFEPRTSLALRYRRSNACGVALGSASRTRCNTGVQYPCAMTPLTFGCPTSKGPASALLLGARGIISAA